LVRRDLVQLVMIKVHLLALNIEQSYKYKIELWNLYI